MQTASPEMTEVGGTPGEATTAESRDTSLITTAAGDMPDEPFGGEGSCSNSAEPERSGTKPERDRRLHVTPQDLSPASAVPREFYMYSHTRATLMVTCWE